LTKGKKGDNIGTLPEVKGRERGIAKIIKDTKMYSQNYCGCKYSIWWEE
jgi:predicted adenine nucleotide alpha hydrolase (AANH) superfamily ATPase